MLDDNRLIYLVAAAEMRQCSCRRTSRCPYFYDKMESLGKYPTYLTRQFDNDY